jgi:hypothetical protein
MASWKSVLASCPASLEQIREGDFMPAFANDKSADDRPPSGFRANLNGAALSDLVQLECLNRVSGAFRITSGNAVGYLFFRQGEIIHAVTDQEIGEPAALVIMGWRDGTFEPCKLDLPESPTITMHWQHLLLRAAQIRDEADRSKLVSFPQKRATPRPPAITRPSAPPPAPAPQVASEPRDMVRLDRAGNVLSSQGKVETLAPSVAYIARMAGLIGEQLGLGPLLAAECQAASSRFLLHVERSGNVVGLRTPNETDVQAIRERFGL